MPNMKLYTNPNYYRLMAVVIPMALLICIGLPMFNGKSFQEAITSNFILFLVVGYVLYIQRKQLKVPLFEIVENKLIINDVRRGKKEVPLDSIYDIKKFMVLGYKLTTHSGEIPIPFRSLSQADADTLLKTLKIELKD